LAIARKVVVINARKLKSNLGIDFRCMLCDIAKVEMILHTTTKHVFYIDFFDKKIQLYQTMDKFGFCQNSQIVLDNDLIEKFD
jgi:hypothetical protein